MTLAPGAIGGLALRAATISGASSGNGYLGSSRQNRSLSKTPVWPARKRTTVSWGCPLTSRASSVKALATLRAFTWSSVSRTLLPRCLPPGQPAGVQHLAESLGVALGEIELLPFVIAHAQGEDVQTPGLHGPS